MDQQEGQTEPQEQQEAPVDWSDLATEETVVAEAEAPVEEDPQQSPPQEEKEKAAEPPAQPDEKAKEPEPQNEDAVRKAEQEYIAQLERMYGFDDETALRLQTEPEKVLPRLAARLHMDVLRTAMAQLQGMLPGMMEQYMRNAEREREAREQFFSAWPELRGYEKQVLEVGKMFRAMNPDADPQTAIQRIGEIAMASLGLQRKPAQQPAAYKPSAPGRTGAPQRQPTVWEEMIEEED